MPAGFSSVTSFSLTTWITSPRQETASPPSGSSSTTSTISRKEQGLLVLMNRPPLLILWVYSAIKARAFLKRTFKRALTRASLRRPGSGGTNLYSTPVSILVYPVCKYFELFFKGWYHTR